MGKKPKRVKRGYPVGLIIGFEPMQVIYWNLYSEQAQLAKIQKLPRKYTNMDKKQRYQFHETLVNELRPILKTGLKSILLVSPPKKTYANDFITHVNGHHRWMQDPKHPNAASLKVIEGNVSDAEAVTALIGSKAYSSAIEDVTESEADQIINLLEQRLNDAEDGFVLHNLKEIEDLVYAGGKRKKKFKTLPLSPEYIVLTSQYLEQSSQKNRVHRLLQIARNRNLRTKIIDGELAAGMRVDQLGGIVCFLKTNSNYERKIGEKILDKE